MKNIWKLSLVALLGTGVISTTANAEMAQTTTTPSTAPAAANSNQVASNAFLAENKKKPGVTTLADGLQYKVITEGNGPIPKDQDTVTVDYAGRLVDGTEFDSSYKRGQPASFQVAAVIPGWTEALKLMKVGSTWELYIPPTLAYGDQGVPPVIGPNQALIFKVHLIDIKK